MTLLFGMCSALSFLIVLQQPYIMQVSLCTEVLACYRPPADLQGTPCSS